MQRQLGAGRVPALAGALVATLLGASVFAYLPLRAATKPAVNFGDPSTLQNFLWVISGGNYKGWFLHDYNVGERLVHVLGLVADHVGGLGAALGLLGVGVLLVRHRALGVAWLLAMAGNLWFFFAYDVHDLEVFFLPTAALLACAIGPGLTAITARISAAQLPRAVTVGLLAATLGTVGMRTLVAYPEADHAGYRAAQAYGDLLVARLPKGAIFLDFTTYKEWKYSAVFRFYEQKTLGKRPDVTIVDIPTPADLHAVFASGRPVFLFAPLEQPDLNRLLEFEPLGPIFRVRPRAPGPQAGS